jgi:hypothetical protein
MLLEGMNSLRFEANDEDGQEGSNSHTLQMYKLIEALLEAFPSSTTQLYILLWELQAGEEAVDAFNVLSLFVSMASVAYAVAEYRCHVVGTGLPVCLPVLFCQAFAEFALRSLALVLFVLHASRFSLACFAASTAFLTAIMVAVIWVQHIPGQFWEALLRALAISPLLFLITVEWPVHVVVDEGDNPYQHFSMWQEQTSRHLSVSLYMFFYFTQNMIITPAVYIGISATETLDQIYMWTAIVLFAIVHLCTAFLHWNSLLSYQSYFLRKYTPRIRLTYKKDVGIRNIKGQGLRLLTVGSKVEMKKYDGTVILEESDTPWMVRTAEQGVAVSLPKGRLTESVEASRNAQIESKRAELQTIEHELRVLQNSGGVAFEEQIKNATIEKLGSFARIRDELRALEVETSTYFVFASEEAALQGDLLAKPALWIWI